MHFDTKIDKENRNNESNRMEKSEHEKVQKTNKQAKHKYNTNAKSQTHDVIIFISFFFLFTFAANPASQHLDNLESRIVDVTFSFHVKSQLRCWQILFW